jgi:muramoyltetrapeptide carboxypeptidase LdcA involved in peptidoglycan recycling
MNIRGGDFSLEVINKLNFKKIIEKQLLVQGFSDTTSLVYTLTTKYDYATLYGMNAKGYDSEKLSKYQLDNLEFMKGNLVDQVSFHDRDTYSINGDFTSSGVMLGGCLDVIRYLLGTPFDGTEKFINKYKDKKIIWHLDIYAMNSVDVYLVLLQMKNMGYFKYSDTFIFGSVKYPEIACELEYSEAYKKALDNKNIIVDANIGHVEPRFTILNGSLGTVEFKNKELRIKQELMYEDNG